MTIDSTDPGPADFFDTSRPQVRRSMTFLALGALIGLAIAGYGLFTAKGTRARVVPPEAIALINNLPILRSDFMTQVQAQFAVSFAQSTPEERKKVLDDMIAEELNVQRGIEIDLPSFDPEVRAAMVAGVELEITADVLAQQPAPQELMGYYERHKSKYVSDGVMQMRELIAPTGAGVSTAQVLETAQQAVQALRGGANLDAVMQRYNLKDSRRLLDAGHVDIGDIFEFAAKAKLSEQVYAVAAPLTSGQISDPVPQPDGAHIVVMVQHRMPVQEDYAAAADKVLTDYKAEAQTRVREANNHYLRSRAEILMAADARKLDALVVGTQNPDASGSNVTAK